MSDLGFDLYPNRAIEHHFSYADYLAKLNDESEEELSEIKTEQTELFEQEENDE